MLTPRTFLAFSATCLFTWGCSSTNTGVTNGGGSGGTAPIAGTAAAGDGNAPTAGTSAVGGSSAGQPSGGTGGASGGSSSGGSNAGSGAGTGGVGEPTGGTFHVDGRFLYDMCNEKVVLRGVNEMVVWSAGKDGLPEFTEIAKTGANAVRIVWNEEGTAAELDAVIGNALAAQLIPMVEHHGATGKLEDVPTVVKYWTQADVVKVLVARESRLLLNIANEAGDDKVTAEAFESTYTAAIQAIRAQGVRVPLIIDAPSWGQDIDRLQASGPKLLAVDKNLMFSVHMWWSDPQGTRVTTELQQSVDAGLPLLVGEFAQHAVYQCDQSPFAYSVLLEEAHKHEIGWLAWSWGSVPNNDCKEMGKFDMTSDGTFGNWTGTWASDVALDHARSIKNTSKRPLSMTSATCTLR